MLDKIKPFLLKLHNYGVPIPLLRDPKTQGPSVSLSMMFISFNVVLVGLIGKWSKVLDIDVTQALYWFLITSSLYFGRSLSVNGKNVKNEQESEVK